MTGVYCVIDVETTGLQARDTIVEFACIVTDETGAVLQVFDTLINPQCAPGPTWLHGITSEMCAEAPTFAEVADTIHGLLVGRVLVAHRLRFDWGMLRRTFDRVGVSFLREAQGICTATLAHTAGFTGGLQRVARALDLEVRQPHRAVNDARTARDVWLRLRAAGHPHQGQPLPPAVGAHRLPRRHAGLSRTCEPVTTTTTQSTPAGDSSHG